jgi:hypothetical protein
MFWIILSCFHIICVAADNYLLSINLADIITKEATGLVVVSGCHPRARVEHHLHALLLVERIVGLAAQPVDRVVIEERVGCAPLEVERAGAVAARCPVTFACPLHFG